MARATSLITSPLTAAAFKTQDLGFAGQPFARPRWITDPMLVRSDDRFPTSDLYPAALRLPRSNFWSEWIRASIWLVPGWSLHLHRGTGRDAPLAGFPGASSLHTACSTERTDGGPLSVIGDPEDGSNQVIGRFRRAFQPGAGHLQALRAQEPAQSGGHRGHVQGRLPRCIPTCSSWPSRSRATPARLFHSTGVPAGFLKVATQGLQQQQADKLKADWMAAHGGSRKSIAVTERDGRRLQMSISPVDSALGEVKAPEHRGHGIRLRTFP